MSYENSRCPCGGKKLPETMLCAECETVVAGTFDRREMDNPVAAWEQRRNAAIRVLSVARKRQAPALLNRLSLPGRSGAHDVQQETGSVGTGGDSSSQNAVVSQPRGQTLE